MSKDPLYYTRNFDVSKYKEDKIYYGIAQLTYAMSTTLLLYLAADQRIGRSENIAQMTAYVSNLHPGKEVIRSSVENKLDTLIGIEALLGWGCLEGALVSRKRQKKKNDEYNQYLAWRSQFIREN